MTDHIWKKLKFQVSVAMGMTINSQYADRLYFYVTSVAMVMIDNTSDLSKGVCVKCMNSNQEPGSGGMGMHMTTCTVVLDTM